MSLSFFLFNKDPVAKTVCHKDMNKEEGVFSKPILISDKLCQFLGLDIGTYLSPSEVTRMIFRYIRIKGLQEGQIISPDSALRDLLDYRNTEKLHMLDLQTYLSFHYIK